MKPPAYYEDYSCSSSNVYRQLAWQTELADDLEELCGELLTEIHCSS
jgi:hypothetical protein